MATVKLYQEWQRKESDTPIIQDTIKKAVDLYGYTILENKEMFCAVLEDLSPNLYEERAFIQKIYSNGIGKRLIEAYMATDKLQRHKYFNKVEEYLKEEEGRSEKWIGRFTAYFSELILDEDMEIDMENYTF